MSWWGIYFYLSRSNKNIITCMLKKMYKFSFLLDTKKWFRLLCSTNFYIQFLYCTLTACWSFCSGLRNKETFNPSFTHLPDIGKQLLRAALEKRRSYYSGLTFVKYLWRVHILVKLQAFFPQPLQKATS